MATFTKNIRTLYAENGLAAGTSATGASTNISTALGIDVTAKVTNGTAPTLPCNVHVEVSGDDSAYYEWAAGSAGVAASTTYYLTFPDIRGPKYVRVRFEGHTANAVTATAVGHEITSIA